jgi:hypothetical protein
MTKQLSPHVYRNPIASADANGVSFVVDQELFVFEMGDIELRRLARQIGEALKEKSARARKPRA